MIEPRWSRLCEWAAEEHLTTWLGVDQESGEVVAQISEEGVTCWGGSGPTSDQAIRSLINAAEWGCWRERDELPAVEDCGCPYCRSVTATVLPSPSRIGNDA